MSTPERQQDPGQHGYGASSKTKRTLARNTVSTIPNFDVAAIRSQGGDDPRGRVSIPR